MSADAVRYPRCIMGTCCVPWTTDYRLDEPLFRQSIDHALKHGTRHLYIFGTAGEGHSVSTKQFQRITKVFADQMTARDAQPMVGLISLSLYEVLDRLDWATSIGVTLFQISLPSWGTCSEKETFTFFQQICTRFPAAAFMHYNLKRAGRLVTATEYARLAEAFPNLVAIKAAGATADDAVAIQTAAPSLRLFLTEKTFAEASAVGVNAGFLISYASLSWPIAKQFFQAGVEGNHAALAKHRGEQTGVLALMRESTADSGVHIDGAFDLLFAKRYLPQFPLRLLPPYTANTDAHFNRFLASIREKYPHWLEGE